MSRQYYLLRSDTKDLSFFDTLKAAFDAVYRKHSVAFEHSFSEPGSGLARHVYLEKARTAAVTLVEDHDTPMYYLIIEAKSDELASRIGSWLGNELPFIPLSELQGNQDPSRDPKSLVRLAVASGEEMDPVTFEIISKAMRHSDSKVRHAAVEAASISQWSEFEPELKRMNSQEIDPNVREILEAAIESNN